MHRPVVGELSTPDLAPRDVPWVLGTQLTTRSGPLAYASTGSRVLLIEALDFADRRPYHRQKLTLLFAGMRHFRDRLRAEGYDVIYLQSQSFEDALVEFFAANPHSRLVVMRSPSDGFERRLRAIVDAADGEIRFLENELFVSTRGAFESWVADRSEPLTHETFYRWMRRQTGILVDDGDPVGGEWNFDDRNREVPTSDWSSPPIPTHEYDELTRETAAWVDEAFDAWGRGLPDTGPWPVTRRQARAHLQHVLETRLPDFGPYQDAMRADDWALSHTLLSGAINRGLLHPLEVIDAIEDAYHEREDVPIHSAEGAIRQLLGWREFVRHAYRRSMPDLVMANRLTANRPLPDLYWTGETDMRCLAETVADVRERGYAHHIQRLMVLANFATLWGVEPSALAEWFQATFVDAYHWVTVPNVIEMGGYGHGVFATKPYVSSANYVAKMSDYCGECVYDPEEDVGAGACPFNALYWDFLARNEGHLRSNHRMAPLYGHVDDRRDDGSLETIRDRVKQLRGSMNEGGI
ncbi:MAG: cryptochrome/photolyase family protein [Halanaeroarchaeum sp.]